jgi:hypothetical protein
VRLSLLVTVIARITSFQSGVGSSSLQFLCHPIVWSVNSVCVGLPENLVCGCFNNKFMCCWMTMLLCAVLDNIYDEMISPAYDISVLMSFGCCPSDAAGLFLKVLCVTIMTLTDFLVVDYMIWTATTNACHEIRSVFLSQCLCSCSPTIGDSVIAKLLLMRMHGIIVSNKIVPHQ